MSPAAAAGSNARGNAGAASDAINDPLKAISQPLLIPQPDGPPQGLDWATVIGNTKDLKEYSKQIQAKRVFAVGGLHLVIDCGLVVDWYKDEATRRDALSLIEKRGARRLLDDLSDKESGDSIFGKNGLQEFFGTFPAVRRQGAKRPKAQQLSSRSARLAHPLRLRKALEFVFLTEAILRYRLVHNEELRARFTEIAGTGDQTIPDASVVWGHMWIEPLIFAPEPAPRPADISRMLEDDSIVSEFTAATGQTDGALYWALKEVPGTLRTAEAAARACNAFYGNHVAQTYAASVAPRAYDAKLDQVRIASASKSAKQVENIVQLR